MLLACMNFTQFHIVTILFAEDGMKLVMCSEVDLLRLVCDIYFFVFVRENNILLDNGHYLTRVLCTHHKKQNLRFILFINVVQKMVDLYRIRSLCFYLLNMHSILSISCGDLDIWSLSGVMKHSVDVHL